MHSCSMTGMLAIALQIGVGFPVSPLDVKTAYEGPMCFFSFIERVNWNNLKVYMCLFLDYA